MERLTKIMHNISHIHLGFGYVALKHLILCWLVMLHFNPSAVRAQDAGPLSEDPVEDLKKFKAQNPTEERQYSWFLSSTFQQNQFESQQNHDVVGTGVILRAGILSFPKNWFYGASIDMQLGPYEFGYNRQLRVDYFGTGLSLIGGYSFTTPSPRMHTGGMISLNYMDISGSSRGSNLKEKSCIHDPAANVDECRIFNATLIENYSFRANMITLSPAYFIGWQKPIKSRSNHPDDLMTSIHGVILAAGMKIPVYSQYNANFDYLAQQTSETDASTYSNIAGSHQRQNEKGVLKGYSFFLEFILNII